MLLFKRRRKLTVTRASGPCAPFARSRGPRHVGPVCLAALSLSAHALAADSSWFTNQTGSWSVDGNWLGGAPHSGDNAIVSNGVGTVDQDFNLNHFTLTGGVIQGGNTINTSGNFTWNSLGRLGGAGTLTSNGTMLIAGSVFADGRTINNAGAAIWSGGDIEPYSNNTTLNNLPGATFWIHSDNNVDSFNGATLTINNAGTFVKQTTTGTSFLFDSAVNNSGTIDVQSGTLALGFSGGSSSGTFNIASGATLAFGDYNFNPGTNFTGSGAIRIGIGDGSPTGTVHINTDLSMANLALTATNTAIDGTNRLTITHQFDLLRGDLLGTGTIQINSAATMNVSSPAGGSHYLFRNIDNAGTVNWSGVALLETGRGAVINNSGLWNFTADQELQRPTSGNGPGMTFNNSGTLSKSAGAGATLLEMNVVNTGMVVVTSGVLDLGFGGTSESGSALNVGPAGTLRFSGLGFWIKDGATLTNNGTLECSLGSLRANANILAGQHLLMNGFELGIDGNLDDDQFTWNRGVLTGTGTTKATTDHIFSDPWGVGEGRTLDTNGHNITWNGGFFGSGFGGSVFGYAGAGTIENRSGSTFSIALPNGVYSIANGTDPVVINNTGAYAQSGDTIQLSGAMNNNGTVQLTNGTLVLQAGGNHNGAFLGNGTLVLNGTNNFGSTSTIDSDFLAVQSGDATLTNTTSGAYRPSGVRVGDAGNSSTIASLTVPANVSVSSGSVTVYAGSNLNVDGGAVAATGSLILDQGMSDSRETGGITVSNNGSISAAGVSVRHATLDLQSGTITASGSFEVTGGTVNFASAGHVTTPSLQLTGSVVNVAPGFAWPVASFSTNGATISLQSGVNLNFATASDISAGGLIVENGATLSVDSMSHAATSQVRGTLNVAHDLALANGSSIAVSEHGKITAETITADGTISLNRGAISTAAGLTLSNSAALTGVGTISGNVRHDGVLIPGAPTGTLTVSGDFSLQADAQSLFQIDASTPSVQTARLEVGGTATLDGLLFIAVAGGTGNLQPGAPIVIIHSAAGVTGTFAGLTEGNHLPAYDADTFEQIGEMSIHYGPDDVELSYVPEPVFTCIMPTLLLLRRRR